MTAPHDTSKGLVLVVDDDFEIREALSDILSLEGYGVATAVDGQDALDRLRGGLQPSVILLDLMMPVMSGYEFCRLIKGDPGLSSIPVIIVSADGETAREATACGADGYMMKPVGLEALLQVVAGATAGPPPDPPAPPRTA
jgi:two-component system chemotaxis response regulator CheY